MNSEEIRTILRCYSSSSCIWSVQLHQYICILDTVSNFTLLITHHPYTYLYMWLLAIYNQSTIYTVQFSSLLMTHYSISVCDYMLYSHKEGSIHSHYPIYSCSWHTVRSKVEEIRCEHIIVNRHLGSHTMWQTSKGTTSRGIPNSM